MLDMQKLCLGLAVALAAASLAASTQIALDSHASANVSHAVTAIHTLQQWYNESTGLWETTGWWNSANILTMLADFDALDNSLQSTIHHVFENTFRQAQQAEVSELKVMTANSVESFDTVDIATDQGKVASSTFPGFINEYYDDEGWWALAWLKVYDITNSTQYLQMASSIFEDMTTGWDAPCGGMWWNKAHTYTGAIENELFLTVAAQLANRVPTLQKSYYLAWALKEWDWFQRSGLINPQYNINNGINLTTCQNDNGTIWSYNQGVIIGGLLELHQATPDDSYLATAAKIAFAAMERLSDGGDSWDQGILHEPCEPNCGADGPQFKGIFMRNLQLLQQAQPNPLFETYIESNADSIWRHDRGVDNRLGLVWSGPFTDATASTQSSACDALVAQSAVRRNSSDLTALG